MSKLPFYADFKVNFKARDFILDFLACLIPGLVFLISITLMVGSLIFLFLSFGLFFNTTLLNISSTTFYSVVFNSFSFQFWFTLSIIFLAYFCGHLLYRQTPKTPDYASFLRIRNKVIRPKDDWVIERGSGVSSNEVQFPYSNLKNYLYRRGFEYLADMIQWEDNLQSKQNPESKDVFIQRSKTFINKMKIRLSTYYPEHTLNMIRNEAHIRLASSMWYATKYIIDVSYYTVLFLVIILFLVSFNTLPIDYIEKIFVIPDKFEFFKPVSAAWLLVFFLISLIVSTGCWIFGKANKKNAKKIMKSWKESNTNGIKKSEEDAKKNANQIDKCFRIHDRCPSFSAVATAVANIFFLLLYSRTPNYDYEVGYLIKAILIYNIFHVFILFGALFGKHRTEETIHYQRVREVFYVLENVFLSKLYSDKDLPDLRSFKD